MKTGRAPLSRFFYVFSGNQRDRICATPSSSLEGAVRSAATSVSGAPFAMATPIPASRRRLRSLVPSPKAAASRGIDPQTAAQGAQSFSLRGVRGVELQVGGHGDGLDQIWERQLALLHHLGPQGQIGEIGLELLDGAASGQHRLLQVIHRLAGALDQGEGGRMGDILLQMV